jgi:general transcription factor 3C polypeptide 3 (transcription factor C subunit 4)
LVLEVADSLFEAEQYKNALVFYEALKQASGQMTASVYVQMGKCLLYEELPKEAEESFHAACKLDEENIEARVELARMFEKMDEAEQAFTYVNQVLDLESIKQPKIYRRRNKNARPAPKPKPQSLLPTGPKPRYKGKKVPTPEWEGLQEEEVYLAEQLQDRYYILRKETSRMRSGDHRAMDVWMDAARALTEDFRSCRAFYPWDKKEFEGYSAEEQIQAQMSLKLDLAALAKRHAQS